jgi:hypothetical protein
VVIFIKTCSICGENKPLSEFYAQKKTKKNGDTNIYYNPECRECTKKRSNKWEIENPKQRKELKKKYDSKPERRLNRRELSRRLREDGKILEWQRSNPDKIKSYNELHRNHSISNEEWERCKNYFNYRCAYCGLKIEEHYVKFKGKTILGDFHKEHVDHEGANDLSNCVPACKRCNTSKWIFPLEEWFNEDNENFSKERFGKINKWINGDYKMI